MINKKQKYSLRVYLILSIFSLFGLSACSPHPGAGTWITDGNNPLKVSTIIVVFEGTADFYSEVIEAASETNKDEDKKHSTILRCFWGSSAENKIQMQCVHAENTDVKETFQFTIIEKNQAKLTQDEQLIALFKKQIL